MSPRQSKGCTVTLKLCQSCCETLVIKAWPFKPLENRFAGIWKDNTFSLKLRTHVSYAKWINNSNASFTSNNVLANFDRHLTRKKLQNLCERVLSDCAEIYFA